MNDSDLFTRFRFAAALKWLLHVAITTVDWSKLFKLLCVLLDAEHLLPGDDIAVKTLIH